MILVLALAALAAPPSTAARAHGATAGPPSRAFACGPEGGRSAQSPACRAAVAASGANALDAWDTIRVPDVAGRDRDRIPDGKLCSGGLGQFAGLDLPRADWPATSMKAGATFDFSYRTTIPHAGTFRLYLTRASYAPTRSLTWAGLEAKPFLTVTDPARRGDAYQFRGKVPAGRTGRHLIYTVWQNADTPDTYYSCSDVLFAAPKPAAAPPTTRRATPASSGPAASRSPVDGKVGQPGSASTVAPLAPVSAVDSTDSGAGPGRVAVAAIAGGVGLVLVGLATLALRGRRGRAYSPSRTRKHAR